MGIRTAVDLIANEHVGDIGGFAQKLKELERTKAIDQRESDLLEALIDAGSASSHRGYFPSAAVLEELLALLEHLVRRFYLNPQALARVRGETPKRR